MNSQPRNPSHELSEAELKVFFISHLNRIDCAKNQLVDKLPLLIKRAHFLDLRQGIEETIEAVQLQIGRMKQMYILLNAFYQPESCVGLIGILDEAFQSIGKPGDNPALRDLSVLFYMQNIENIETASFKSLLRVSERLRQPDIVQLLRECYDEAQEDKILFGQITENYL
jgi:ferritin-like metal-binding protein YciE